MARTDLYYLLRYLLNRKDIENEWLLERCIEVQESPDGHLDLWAREHYKSTIITFAKSIQDIVSSHGMHPDSKWNGVEVTIGIFSHTRPVAKKFLRQIKRELEENQILKSLFPDILYRNPQRESPTWSEDSGLKVKRQSNPKEATIEAWGLVDGQPVGAHFVILNYDDVVTLGSVSTPDMIRKTTNALELSYDLIQTKGGIKRMIGTRYHAADSYSSVLKKDTFQPRLIPATSDGTVEGEPVFWDEFTWKKKLKEKSLYNAACQYLLNPLADKAMGFHREWIRHYELKGHHNMNRVLLCDPANEKKKRSDFTAMAVIGLGPDRNYYILDLVRDKLNLTERTRMFIRLHRKWRPYFSGYEKYGKDSDIQHIKYVQQEINYRFDIKELGGSMAKNDRIRRLIPLFEQARVYIPNELHKKIWDETVVDMVEEFLSQEFDTFPVGAHEDMLDCMSRIQDKTVPLRWPFPETEKDPYQRKTRDTTSFMAF